MQILGRVTVQPTLPDRIGRLGDLAANLYWTWVPGARKLFRDLDRELWDQVQDSPVAVLREIDRQKLEDAATDPEFLKEYDSVLADFDTYMAGAGWFGGNGAKGDVYAYFCAEYGWHESIQIYSGGLGILAGDHTKAASDLGIPLVGVGLWYPQGYFHQRVAADGSQKAEYGDYSPEDFPFERVVDADGRDVTVSVNVYGSDVQIRAWLVRVGRVQVYLLDVDFGANSAEDRKLVRRLYGGDQRTRVAQEAILGIGGVRMLRKLGIAPTTWHMNEGHSAFMVLERSRELVGQGLGFREAREAVAANTLFTVHTPVAAGNDAFDFSLVHECLGPFWHALGLNQAAFDNLARADQGWGDVFSMGALALRFSTNRNGVAELHGDTSRRIWSDLWPGVPQSEVPITHVTNGVHRSTWMARDVQDLLDRHLPSGWREEVGNPDLWQAVENVDQREFWDMRQSMKRQSLRFLRRRLVRQLKRQNASSNVVAEAAGRYNADALTIGFARRFATYKRATLILQDLDRLDALLNSQQRPVQLVFAGKAHPADEAGQELISTIDRLSRDPRFAGSILFVEDYDMAVGRALTRGVDVWLNNPRRPLEASGTSGEKAAMNGVLNLSVLDGWWPEGFDGYNGWAFGWTEPYTDVDVVDRSDAEELMDLLENEVVPLFYDRDRNGLPDGWISRSKRAVMTIAPNFSAQRMVLDYVRDHYQPLSERQRRFAGSDHQAARELAAWRQAQEGYWPGVQVRAELDGNGASHRELSVRAMVTGVPAGEDVRVQLLYARAGTLPDGEFRTVDLQPDAGAGAGSWHASFLPLHTGTLEYAVRVQAVNDLLGSAADGGFIKWA